MPCFVKMFLCFIVRCVRACPQEGGASKSLNRLGEITSKNNPPHGYLYIPLSYGRAPCILLYESFFDINTSKRTKMGHVQVELRYTNMNQIELQEGLQPVFPTL